MNQKTLSRNKALSILISLCMVLSLFAGMTGMANAADVGTDGAIVTGGDTITASGTYQVATDATGIIQIATGLQVSLIGKTTETHSALTIDCGADVDLTIDNLQIAGPANETSNVIDYSGTSNKLNLKGENLLELQDTDYSLIHVGQGTELEINGPGTLYFYKHSSAAAIGGDYATPEVNGKITINGGTIFGKGSKMGAVIGTSGNAESGTPGDITINGGSLNIIGNAQGAIIGTGKNTTVTPGNVYINGGSINFNIDFNAGAIGKGNGSTGDAGNGKVYIAGGSIRSYIDENAVSSWSANGVTKRGVNDVVISADKYNNSTENANMYLMKFDTSKIDANTFSVKVDGKEVYNGGIHQYKYVNEDKVKSEQASISATKDNWVAGEDSTLYIYATGENHKVTVNGEPYAATWDSTTNSFTLESCDTSWYEGHENDTSYTINTKAQLTGLAAIVNGTASGITKTDFAGKKITLGKDIALDTSNDKYTSAVGTFGQSDYPMKATYYTVKDDANIWTPIGTGVATANSVLSSSNYFAGEFDGAGHTVSGIYTNGTLTTQGLFGCLGEGGTIKNLKTQGCITAKFLAGGIAAYVKGGTIENCTNEAIVYADGGEKADSGIENGIKRGGAIGGIAGNAIGTTDNPVTLKNCKNTGTVTCTNTCKGGRAGGILGLVDTADSIGSVSQCINTAAIDSYQYAGGMIGMDAGTAFPIEKCVNTALIKVHSPGSAYAGGMVANCSSNITDCYNRGEVTIEFNNCCGDKAAHAGGIVSDMGAAKITNCYNTATVTKSGTATSSSSMGAIAGSSYTGKIYNCYYVEGSDEEQGTVKTLTELKEKGMPAELSSSYTMDANAINDGYPVLKWQNTEKDSAEAGKVIAKIKAIGTVTTSKKARIKTARSAYNALSIDQKSLVTNYSTLTKDETILKNIIAAKAKKTTAKASSVGMKTVKVSWKKVSGVTGYKIYRATTKTGKYKKVKTITKATTTKWINKKLNTGEKYYYVVRPYKNIEGKVIIGKVSKKTVAKPIPTAPSIKLKASGNSIKCKWSKVSDVSGYVVYRDNGNGKYKKIFTQKTGRASAYTSVRLRNNKTYKYKMKSFKVVNNKRVYSKDSKVKTVKTK